MQTRKAEKFKIFFTGKGRTILSFVSSERISGPGQKRPSGKRPRKIGDGLENLRSSGLAGKTLEGRRKSELVATSEKGG